MAFQKERARSADLDDKDSFHKALCSGQKCEEEQTISHFQLLLDKVNLRHQETLSQILTRLDNIENVLATHLEVESKSKTKTSEHPRLSSIVQSAIIQLLRTVLNDAARHGKRKCTQL